MNPRLLMFLSVLLDAVPTHLGLWLGLGENGPLASRLMPSLGVLYWLLELGVLLIMYYIRYTGLLGSRAALATVVGPWAAGWSNLCVVLRHAGVLVVGV
ncbi:MAG: hypothetical protein GSR86_05820 [Desulfurococcales archaeon]|nr:hypothetical protein [Desulfurococcales archaeon]